MLGAMVSAANLVLAGVMEEIFGDSMFNATNSHCINSVFALVLPPGARSKLRCWRRTRQSGVARQVV